jgi:hypothetical protein
MSLTAEEIARRRAEAIANRPPRTVSPSKSSLVMTGECQAEETEAYEPSWSREFPRKPDIQYASDIAAQLERVGQIDRPPRKKVGWKKSRADRKKPEPLREKVAYITIYSHHHRNRDYSWIDVAILSEIDFWMQKEKKSLFREYAPPSRCGPDWTGYSA